LFVSALMDGGVIELPAGGVLLDADGETVRDLGGGAAAMMGGLVDEEAEASVDDGVCEVFAHQGEPGAEPDEAHAGGLAALEVEDLDAGFEAPVGPQGPPTGRPEVEGEDGREGGRRAGHRGYR
jgi:hypothetical protein